jgi:hypothetical protein
MNGNHSFSSKHLDVITRDTGLESRERLCCSDLAHERQVWEFGAPLALWGIQSSVTRKKRAYRGRHDT